MADKIVVKRKGHHEVFDEKKLYASVYSACRSAHLGEQQSEMNAQKVLDAVLNQIKDKKVVNSDQIFELVHSSLAKLNKDSGYMYKTHRDIS